MKVTGTDGKEVTAVTTNTGFIISKGVWLLLSATTTSTGNKPWRCSRFAFSCMWIPLIRLTGTSNIIRD
jgi:hypothetical protein